MHSYKILSFSVVILLITVVFAGAVPAAAQTDTMQFRYNAQHTGDYSPVAGPVPSNGQLLWHYATLLAVVSSPAVANGTVYVGSNDGNVYALNATTGAKLWKYTTRDSFAVSSSPAVVNGVVYVGSDDHNVYALNANNGTKLWNYTTGDDVRSSPAVVNGVVYVGSDDNNVYALNAATGAKLWNYTTGGHVESSPAAVNGVVYVGSYDNNTYALNANNGTKLWNYTTGDSVSSSPAVVNGVVYVGSDDHNVYALNAATGAKLWDYTTGDDVRSSPAVANGVVYVGSFDHNVYALNANNGTKLWNYTTGDLVPFSPAVANGVVYVGSFDNNTYALNAATGAKLWNYTTGDSVSSSSAVVNGVVYVGSWDMNVYAIGNKSMSTPTTLTAAAPSSASVNQNFTINGTLNAMLDPVGGATITLQQNESGTWNNITTTATDTNGSYQFSNSESAAGTYQYRTTYAGNASYTNATSYTVTVQVTTIPTQLSAAANITTAYVGQNFAINGTLNTTNGTAIAGAIITLQKNVSWAWTNVATNVTDANGTYQFSDNESVAGSYQYRTTYAGNAAYINATSNTVSVQVTTIPTQLSAAANLTTAYVNQNFTINGTLNSTDGTAIAGATITLQKNVSGTWQNVTGNTASTTSTGAYGISTSESAAGTYQYRAVYAGNATFGNATSNAVAVTVSRHSTTLSATVSTNVVAVNKPFSINGRLRSGATGLAGATITLQRSTNNATWNNVTSATTSAAGEYQFSRSESSTGTYQYRTVYGGNVTYANATSNVVSVKVTSKASVLADLNRLELTVVGMPSSAFTPGTKIATLAVISAAEINVRAGNYGAATNELQRALLARTDGCSATAKPDNNDWVRTCAAQAQLYPQVQNLIQELQALQGS